MQPDRLVAELESSLRAMDGAHQRLAGALRPLEAPFLRDLLGLMSEHIAACRRTAAAGVDFRHCSAHTGQGLIGATPALRAQVMEVFRGLLAARPPLPNLGRAKRSGADAIALVDTEVSRFYGTAVRCHTHAFIEWTGLLNEWLHMARENLRAGRDLVHDPLRPRDHHRRYAAEKLGCIFESCFPGLEDELCRMPLPGIQGPGTRRSALC